MKVLVLSPHFDDAPLSLGQAMLDGALADHDISVGVLFSATNWTRWWYPKESRARLVSAIRRAEEAVTARRFGYSVQTGGLKEVILRTGSLDPSTFLHPLGPSLDDSTKKIVESVEKVILGWAVEADVVLSPLGIGDHHDHQITARAALAARDRGVDVAFYEDRPYVAWAGGEAPAEVVERVDARLQRRAVSSPITAGKHRKLFYPSQLDPEFQHAIAADESEDRREHLWVLPDAAWPLSFQG